MTDERIIQWLNETEAQLRTLEHRLFSIRRALRQRIDPHKQREDLGYWPDEDAGGWRPKVKNA